MPSAPFAYGPSGRTLTSTEGREVFVCEGEQEAPLFVRAMSANIVGVRNTDAGVLVLDENGELTLLTLPQGRPAWSVSNAVNALALASTPAGAWAVIHERGALLGTGDQTSGSVDAAEVVAGCFGQSQSALALVTRGGNIIITDLSSTRSREVAFGPGVEANGVAWSSLGWWLVSTSSGVFRIAPGDDKATLYLKWGGEHCPRRVVTSADGKLCAFLMEDTYVIVFGVEQDINCGSLVYVDRHPSELEFGPDHWLGVGLGRGDANKIDLLTGAVHRNDPPEGRERNRWMLQVGLDNADLRRALGLAPAIAGVEVQDMSQLARAKPGKGLSMPVKVFIGINVAFAAFLGLWVMWTIISS